MSFKLNNFICDLHDEHRCYFNKMISNIAKESYNEAISHVLDIIEKYSECDAETIYELIEKLYHR